MLPTGAATAVVIVARRMRMVEVVIVVFIVKLERGDCVFCGCVLCMCVERSVGWLVCEVRYGGGE